MKKIKKYITMAVAGVMVLSFTGCNMIAKTDEAIQNTVLAKVGDTKITRGDVDSALKPYLEQYKEQYGDDYESDESLQDTLLDMRTQELEYLVDNEVLKQSQDTLGVNPTDEEIQSQVDETIQYYKDYVGSDEAYESFLATYGYDSTSFEEYLKEQTLLQMISEAMVADVEVTDQEIEDYYNENIDTYTTQPGADVTHLLFAPETDADGNAVDGADEAAKALAESAREQALAGTSLEDLSNSDEFKDHCTYEDLGRVSFEDSGMVQEFEDAFKVLAAGEVSDVVQTSYGYHIIVNTNVYPDAEVQELDDTLKETIRSSVLSDKQQTAYDDKLAELKENIKIKLYEGRL